MVQFSEETKVGPPSRHPRRNSYMITNLVFSFSLQERVSKVIDISRVAIH
jgi:hypothetical protein